MKNLLFRIRYALMPNEFKKGTWLFIGGSQMNLDEMWRKSKKKGWWHIPRIDKYFGD